MTIFFKRDWFIFLKETDELSMLAHHLSPLSNTEEELLEKHEKKYWHPEGLHRRYRLYDALRC